MHCGARRHDHARLHARAKHGRTDKWVPVGYICVDTGAVDLDSDYAERYRSARQLVVDELEPRRRAGVASRY
jgi:hypothetical protein